MTAASAVSLPTGRVVLGWWRELSALPVLRCSFAQLQLYRVEVLVEIASHGVESGLAKPLLALLSSRSSPFQVDSLASELHVTARLLGDVLRDLAQAGLVRPTEGGADAWVASPSGTQSLNSGNASNRAQRRTFFFTVENPPVYLPLSIQAATPMAQQPEGCRFDLAVLEACVEQLAQWKSRHGFPGDVLRVVPMGAEGREEDWRRVSLARVEQALLMLVETTGGAVLGFPVRADGWTLGKEPVLSLPGGVEAVSWLLGETSPEAWKPSWQAWCQQRSVPAGEVEACKLELQGHRLLIHAPARLIERLRASRSDALKGEAWLLAATGRVRAIALIELRETL